MNFRSHNFSSKTTQEIPHNSNANLMKTKFPHSCVSLHNMLNFMLMVIYFSSSSSSYSKENAMKTVVNFRLNKGCDIYEKAIHESAFMVKVFFSILIESSGIIKRKLDSFRLGNVNSIFHMKLETLSKENERKVDICLKKKKYFPTTNKARDRRSKSH